MEKLQQLLNDRLLEAQLWREWRHTVTYLLREKLAASSKFLRLHVYLVIREICCDMCFSRCCNCCVRFGYELLQRHQKITRKQRKKIK